MSERSQRREIQQCLCLKRLKWSSLFCAVGLDGPTRSQRKEDNTPDGTGGIGCRLPACRCHSCQLESRFSIKLLTPVLHVWKKKIRAPLNSEPLNLDDSTDLDNLITVNTTSGKQVQRVYFTSESWKWNLSSGEVWREYN